MKVLFTVKDLSESSVELIDEQGFSISLPSRYFSTLLAVNQSLTINFDEASPAREILQEIFKQNQ